MSYSIKKKLGIVVSDGVGYRNFILSDFIKETKQTFDEVIVYSCLPKSAYEHLNLNIKIKELAPYKENFITWFFRKAKEVAHLQKFAKQNFGIHSNLIVNNSKAKNARGIASRFIFYLTTYFHSENTILFFNWLQQFTYRFYSITKEYEKLINQDELDMLFFTHQRPPFIAPLILIAKKLHIKTATFIFSWDNLASKGRMSGNFDFYLVWSRLMKKELLDFYESINENQIAIAGTPQFEPYILPRYQSTKEDFFQRFNLDPNHKTISFSCGDISTSKNDELYISVIAEFILSNTFGQPINFIVRTSPAENPDRFFSLVDKYPFIKWNYPNWYIAAINHPEPWTQRIPAIDDIKDLRSLLEFCDLNINMCSTMSLDNMLFDKPVINPVFGNAENGLFDDQMFLKFAHYKLIAESGSVIIAKNKDELYQGINNSLNNPTKASAQRAAMIETQIGNPLLGTSKRFASTLFQWS